jgi:hypothetical protein
VPLCAFEEDNRGDRKIHFPMPQRRVPDFDFAGRVRIDQRSVELEERNRKYIADHPELQQSLHDLMESLVTHKPDDALAFIQNHVRLLREKEGNASAM